MLQPRIRLFAEWAAALLITVLSLATMLNGSLISTWGSNHVDLSINLTAAHALRDGEDPYGLDTLEQRAESLGSPTAFIYSQLFTSYIQPPTSALSLLPLTALDWREATRVYLVLNHVFLFAAAGLTLYTLRPAMSLRWLVAGSALILAAYQQVNASFALGQVDATITLLLAIAFWAYTRGYAPLAGGAIALGAAIKLIPGLLLLYFLWKREYRAAAWGAGVGLAVLLASLAYVGPNTYETYFSETVPALLKGSTHYTNASLGAAISRVFAPELVGGIPDIVSLSEVPSDGAARFARLVIGLAALAALAVVIPRGAVADRRRDAGRLFVEFYLVVSVGLLISSVTWEFYVIWLLPVFLAAFLARERILPRGPLRWAFVPAFVATLIALNFPGDCGSSLDCYLFEGNDFFYHPAWVPGVWLERQLGLYTNHLDAVLYLRLPALMLVTGLLTLLVLQSRRREAMEEQRKRIRIRLSEGRPQAVKG